MDKHGTPWTKEDKRFLLDNMQDMDDDQLAEELGRTTDAIRTYRYKNNIDKFGGRKCKRWSDEEDELLEEMWPQAPIDEIRNALPGRSYNAIKERAISRGITRDPRFSESVRFKPKRIYKHTSEGVVTICDTGGREYCILNKEGKEILYHRVLWEKENGPIPEGHILRCRSDDTTNPEPENWELITKGEHARRNVTDSEGLTPAERLSDGFVAAKLAEGDKELKNFIIDERPDMIRAARANYQLKRQINHGSEEK